MGSEAVSGRFGGVSGNLQAVGRIDQDRRSPVSEGYGRGEKGGAAESAGLRQEVTGRPSSSSPVRLATEMPTSLPATARCPPFGAARGSVSEVSAGLA